MQCHNASKLAYIINKLRSKIASIHNSDDIGHNHNTNAFCGRYHFGYISFPYTLYIYANACAKHLSGKQYFNMIRCLINLTF